MRQAGVVGWKTQVANCSCGRWRPTWPVEGSGWVPRHHLVKVLQSPDLADRLGVLDPGSDRRVREHLLEGACTARWRDGDLVSRSGSQVHRFVSVGRHPPFPPGKKRGVRG